MATLSTSISVALCRRSDQRIPSTKPYFFSRNHPQRLISRQSSNYFAKSAVRSAAVRPPPESDPPPEKEPVRHTGFLGVLSKLQDRVQIFFAVLFWMSLFFWTSVWDGRNRPNKDSQFRR